MQVLIQPMHNSSINSVSHQVRRKPEWLKIHLPNLKYSAAIISLLKEKGVNTICSSGLCPNRGECWNSGTATFMIAGDVCTRSCRFCATKTGKPHGLPDISEIQSIVQCVKALELKHMVITSVDRDDLPDGGANHWASVITALRVECPGVTIETLIPDFRGDEKLIDIIINCAPDVISHNIETVERITPKVRSVATYRGSLNVLRQVSRAGIRTKSGLMVGLGETHDEIIRAMDDLLEAGCDIITIGQYLQPTPEHIPVDRYITPYEFDDYRRIALNKGFLYAESGPFVRSSYHAERHVR